MKKAALYIPVILSLLVLAAHFLRSGDSVLAFASLVVPALLLVPQPWAARLVQLVLVLGALEWIRTLIILAQGRIADGEPFVRLTVILGVVVIVTGCSALVFQTAGFKRFYRLNGRNRGKV